MRGQTLDKLLNGLRAEARLSLDPAHNLNDEAAQIMHLQRVQEWLWDDHDWPHLRVERMIAVEANRRFYDFPADLTLDRVEKLEFFADGGWSRLTPGIDSGCYTLTNSAVGETQWPLRRWRLYEAEDQGDQAGTQFEVWPVSDRDFDPTTQAGILKFTGIRKLAKLDVATDKADLDDRAIVLFAAAERLASAGAKDAQAKQQLALKRYAKIRGETQIVRRFRMFGIGAPQRSRFGLPLGGGSFVFGPPSGAPLAGSDLLPAGSDLLPAGAGGANGNDLMTATRTVTGPDPAFITLADGVVLLNGPASAILPENPFDGFGVTLKDFGSVAARGAVAITTPDNNLIDGTSTYRFTVVNQAVEFVFTRDRGWIIT